MFILALVFAALAGLIVVDILRTDLRERSRGLETALWALSCPHDGDSALVVFNDTGHGWAVGECSRAPRPGECDCVCRALLAQSAALDYCRARP